METEFISTIGSRQTISGPSTIKSNRWCSFSRHDNENVLKQYLDCDSETSTSVNDTWLSRIDLSICVYPTDACNECDFIKNATKQQKHLYIIFNITAHSTERRQTNFCGGKGNLFDCFLMSKILISLVFWHTSSIGIPCITSANSLELQNKHFWTTLPSKEMNFF